VKEAAADLADRAALRASAIGNPVPEQQPEHPTELLRRVAFDAAAVETPERAAIFERFASTLPDRGGDYLAAG
jgi:hypothetical protein